MSFKPKSTRLAIAASLGIATLTACANQAPTSTPAEYLSVGPLDRNSIGVSKRTEFLEIALNPDASQLSLADRKRISGFVYAYRDSGHGPLIMSMPKSTNNPQLAVAAIAEARAIAWESGVNYDEMAGNSHDKGTGREEPMVLAFQVYDAIAPDCKSMAAYDVSDVTSNNELPSLGCSVRTNMAAMIADPADLLGQRPLEAGDNPRRTAILQKFRLGESTGSERSQEETGTVTDAVEE